MAIANYTVIHKVVDLEVRGPNNVANNLSIVLEAKPAARLVGGVKGEVALLFTLSPVEGSAKPKNARIKFGMSEMKDIMMSLHGALIDAVRIRSRL